MNELYELVTQLIELLDQSDEGYEELWAVRTEIKKMIYIAGMECVPLASSFKKYYEKCRDIIEILEQDSCKPQLFLEKLCRLKVIIDQYREQYDYCFEVNRSDMTWFVINENSRMRDTTLRLNREYDRFMSRILKGDNFAFIRCADGEYCFMNGLPAHAADWRHATAAQGDGQNRRRGHA